MFLIDRYERVLKKESLYIDRFNYMLRNKESGGLLYILDNDISLHKLLHHPESQFKNKTAEVNIKIFTWKKGKMINKNIKELLEMNADIFLIKPTTEHYIAFDNPKKNEKILWAERVHYDFSDIAYDCCYTSKPYQEVWEAIINHFSYLEKSSDKIVSG